MARNILLIGGNSGIGLSTAKRLQAKGDHLTVAARSNDQLTQLGIPTQAFDATDPAPTLTLPDSLDGVVYCPGTINLKPFHRLSEADFLADLQVNLLGAIRVLQLALPALKRSPSASVVLFSTVAVNGRLKFASTPSPLRSRTLPSPPLYSLTKNGAKLPSSVILLSKSAFLNTLPS